MAGGLFAGESEDAIFLSRYDPEHPLGTFSPHAFELEDKEWPSVEHYFQAMQFADPGKQEKVRLAATPKDARRRGAGKLFNRPRSGWKHQRVAYMTRGVYIKCKTHPEVAEMLLATYPKKLVENDQYDYFWGCGRDRRGENMYGQVLMNVRTRLMQEDENASG